MVVVTVFGTVFSMNQSDQDQKKISENLFPGTSETHMFFFYTEKVCVLHLVSHDFIFGENCSSLRVIVGVLVDVAERKVV